MGSFYPTLQQYSTYHQLHTISTSNELPLAGYLELVFRACSENCVQHPHPAGLFKMPKIRSCSTCRHDKDSGAHDWVTPGFFFTYQPSKSMELSVLDYIIIIKYSFIYIYICIHSYIYMYKFIHVNIHSCIYSCKCI